MEYKKINFVERIAPTAWLFQDNNTVIPFVCGNITYTERVNGSGILKFDTRCSVNMSNMVMHNLANERSDLFIRNEHWETIRVESAGPVYENSLTQLKSAVDDLKQEHTMHRYLHAHHTLIIYTF